MAKYVFGLRNVEMRIQRELAAIKGRTRKGMFEAMRFLENQMDTVNPVVPIKTKAMRDSWYVRTANTNVNNPVVMAGYASWYAPIVHENIGAVNWTRPGSGPKWLQIHYDRSRREMFLIVGANARIPRTRAGSSVTYTHISNRTNERNVEF